MDTASNRSEDDLSDITEEWDFLLMYIKKKDNQSLLFSTPKFWKHNHFLITICPMSIT